MTVLSTPYLELSIRIWLAIPFSGGVCRPEFKSFFLSKKYRLLRCSLLSKLDIWKRIVELVRTCSLWLLHILLLDFFHLNTRCRHTRVHSKFIFEKYIIRILWYVLENDVRFCKSNYDILFSYMYYSSILVRIFKNTILRIWIFSVITSKENKNLFCKKILNMFFKM